MIVNREELMLHITSPITPHLAALSPSTWTGEHLLDGELTKCPSLNADKLKM